jgi:hypothetical protein
MGRRHRGTVLDLVAAPNSASGDPPPERIRVRKFFGTAGTRNPANLLRPPAATAVATAHCFSSETCTLKLPARTDEADSCTATVSPALTVALCALSAQVLLELSGQPMFETMPLI